jgi:hypothetical protein
VFDSKYFILDEAPKIIKFNSKSIERVFVGYSSTSKAYRIYIPTSQIMVESVHIKFDETINIGAEKGSSIVCDGAEDINALNDNQAIIVEDVQVLKHLKRPQQSRMENKLSKLLNKKCKMLQQLKKKRVKLCERSIMH